MSLTGVLRAAVFAAAIGCPCEVLAQEDVIVAPEPRAAVASQTPIADAIAANAAVLASEAQDTARPVAIEYSDAHLMRGKIHKYASFATLPLFATEFALGQSLYNDPQSLTSSKRGIHGAVGAGLIGLFAANSVTGVWNLLDESGTTPGHTRRLVHGLIMLAAEGGLIASASSAPGHGRGELVNFDTNKATHRNIAVASISVGTAGYLLMLFGGTEHMLGGSLHDALINWGSFFANHAVVRTLVTFLHVGAIMGAGGAAVTADRGILAALRLDDRARQQQLATLRQTHRIVVAGLACIAVSGLLLFASDVDSFLYSKMFWTKMSLVSLLLVNGAVLVSAEDRAARGAADAWRMLHFTAFASVALWFLVTLAGVALLNIG